MGQFNPLVLSLLGAGAAPQTSVEPVATPATAAADPDRRRELLDLIGSAGPQLVGPERVGLARGLAEALVQGIENYAAPGLNRAPIDYAGQLQAQRQQQANLANQQAVLDDRARRGAARAELDVLNRQDAQAAQASERAADRNLRTSEAAKDRQFRLGSQIAQMEFDERMRALASATDLEVAAIRRAAQLDKLNRDQRVAVGQVQTDIVDDMRIVRAGLQEGTITEQDIREMLESYEGRLLQFDEPQRFYLESKLAPFQSMLDDIALSQTAAGQPEPQLNASEQAEENQRLARNRQQQAADADEYRRAREILSLTQGPINPGPELGPGGEREYLPPNLRPSRAIGAAPRRR